MLVSYFIPWTCKLLDFILYSHQPAMGIRIVTELCSFCTDYSYWLQVAELQKGVRYGCPLEDVTTGLQIQCRGWRSVYYNPKRKGFLGMTPTSLGQILVLYKRWTEGFLQISLSRYSPFLLGHGKIKLGLQMGYSVCGFWAVNSFPTLYYVTIPSLCFLNGISLFPEVSFHML